MPSPLTSVKNRSEVVVVPTKSSWADVASRYDSMPMVPDSVRQVITLGSPFAGDPRSTNAWRVYEWASGRKADEVDPRFGGELAAPPPVPTTAIFSRTDGVCAWQGCMEKSGAQTESIEVESSHCGMGHHPAAVYAVADRLAQEDGQWRPFDRSGWRSLAHPDPHR